MRSRCGRLLCAGAVTAIVLSSAFVFPDRAVPGVRQSDNAVSFPLNPPMAKEGVAQEALKVPSGAKLTITFDPTGGQPAQTITLTTQ